MKRLYTLVAILLIILSVAFVNQKTQSKPKHNMPVVGVLTLLHHPALDQIYDGFVKEMAKQGYHKDKNYKLEYQNAQGDQSNLEIMSKKLVNMSPDILVGITTPASQSLAHATSSIPIVLGAVTNPKKAGLVANNDHPNTNISGVSDQAPVEEQLKLVKKLMPKNAKVGIIYTSNDSSAVTEHDLFVKMAKKYHVNLKSYSIANSNDLNQVSQKMLNEVDAVIVPTDNTIAGAMQTLVKNADAVRKPIFPAVDTMVKQDGLATYGINQNYLGVLIARLVVDILKGKKKIATTPIQYVRHGIPILNLKKANQLGIKIPVDFLKECIKEGEVFE
ncbi:tryptophan ABC transporter substrate-binding protein [Lactobacillus iners]|uniref:tryptophan ABC transporter substrate-binding protein n=1 Tax=Lactobacillus iners TaxID=147802 RepID=UPI0001E99E3D|nr:tryptophan ABC transporter substrate-binding protein [Lactobacillus iners]EFQ51338.1 ABC transporter substrate binding protein [Lactobacillus iners LEAF 3008A-a]